MAPPKKYRNPDEPKKRPRGRPPVPPGKRGFDPFWVRHPERGVRLQQAIAAGATYTDACAYAEVSRSAFNRWRKIVALALEKEPDDRTENESAAVAYFGQIEKAEASTKLRLITRWQSAADKDWRAAKSFLSVRYPEEWAEKKQVELSGSVGISMADLHAAVTDDDDEEI